MVPMLARCLTLLACLLVPASMPLAEVSPLVLELRKLMDGEAMAKAEALGKHVPPGGSEQLNIRYASGENALLDVFHPPAKGDGATPLPTVVWIHGGAFVAGDKSHVANYLRIIANEGYTTVGINYTLAPDAQYPTPVEEANQALAYLVANAADLHIDPDRIFLAGDSAGAQIAAQLAIVISAPDYAAEMKIVPAIARQALRGVVLFCGLYDPEMMSAPGIFGGFLSTVAEAYLGTKDFLHDPRTKQFSIVGNLTPALPALFISAGDADPLAPQSVTLTVAARALRISVLPLLLNPAHAPPVGHEYQFDLDTDVGQLALERVLVFLTVKSR